LPRGGYESVHTLPIEVEEAVLEMAANWEIERDELLGKSEEDVNEDEAVKVDSFGRTIERL